MERVSSVHQNYLYLDELQKAHISYPSVFKGCTNQLSMTGRDSTAPTKNGLNNPLPPAKILNPPSAFPLSSSKLYPTHLPLVEPHICSFLTFFRSPMREGVAALLKRQLSLCDLMLSTS